MTTTSGVPSVAQTATQGQQDQGSKADKSAKKLNSDMNMFLNLLTTQLKYQDPLSPMDSTEFTNQLVQYSNVEQNIQTNSNLETLISTTNASITATAVSYIGKTVQVYGENLPLQDGAAKFSYALGKDAASCIVAIKDSSGKIVRSLEVEKSAGNHVMTWDGKDKDGNQLEDGAYSISVSALDFDGSSIKATPTTFGKVTTVANDKGKLLLGMDDVLTSMDNVVAVREYEKITFEDEKKPDSGSGGDGDKNGKDDD